jgi:two-component system KDP operon response regulator KdpE
MCTMYLVPDFTVLLIDSDGAVIAPVVALVIVALRTLGAEVLRARTGAQGLRRLYDERPDVVVLTADAGPPGPFETLARMRGLTSVPVLMVGTGAGTGEDMRALAAGADDYVTPPVDADELATRIRRLAERAQRAKKRHRVFSDGGLEIDFAAVEVSLDGAPIRLTRLEYRLLEVLVEHSGEVVETERLLQLAWDEPIFDRTRVKAHIAAVRRKLGPASGRIDTIRGAGYRYRPLGPKTS